MKNSSEVKNSCEEWTEQVWIATPLPDGGVTVMGRTYNYHTSVKEVKSEEGKEVKSEERSVKNTSVSKSSETNDVKTTFKRSPNEVLTILCIWLIGIVIIVYIGYWIVKWNNK